jgi:hypothetical protein
MGEVSKINGWATVFVTPKPEKQVIATEKSGRSLTAQQVVTKNQSARIFNTSINVIACYDLNLREAGRSKK